MAGSVLLKVELAAVEDELAAAIEETLQFAEPLRQLDLRELVSLRLEDSSEAACPWAYSWDS